MTPLEQAEHDARCTACGEVPVVLLTMTDGRKLCGPCWRGAPPPKRSKPDDR